MEKQAVRRELRRKEKTEIDQMLTDIGKKEKQLLGCSVILIILGHLPDLYLRDMNFMW